MNAIEQIIRWVTLAPYFEWRERRRVRAVLLATPGVDRLVREVMDAKYGKHAWRVRDGNLEAQVLIDGQNGAVTWGLIGPIRSHNTRVWLANMSLDMKGAGQHDAPYKIEPPKSEPIVRSSPYWGAYQDTIPTDPKE